MSRFFVTRFTAFLAVALAIVGSARADGPIIETRHYRIHTDLDRDLSADLAKRMDAMYDVYAQRLADFKPAQEAPPLEVYLFKTQADYLKFAGEQYHNTGGIFMSGRNLLAAFLEGQGRDALRRTLQHEAFHQFAHAYISPDLPVWLNEGLAQLFEEGIWTGQAFWLGQVPPRRIRQLGADLKGNRLVEFTTMVNMSPDQWQSNLAVDHEMGATQYNQSWAMVHFLVNAKDENGKEKYRALLMQMLQLIHGGKSGRDAFNESFGGNVAGFQTRFLEFAKQLKASPEATLIENQGVLADLLTELKTRGETFTELIDFKRAAVKGRYRLHYTRGQLKWHSDPNVAKYFADLDGKAFGPEQLFLDLGSRKSPLPDIVCRCLDKVQLRTRFFAGEHELLVEPIEKTSGAR